uniref:WGS project CBMG000000000 data, contig CS5907-c001999 n=1 Tax=Fusarium acuminatum CS5907 TaxID=1318461 RepID=A0A090M9C1_9HYPO|nr:unnamed protein product [Fusarium acuminatum CS5907]
MAAAAESHRVDNATIKRLVRNTREHAYHGTVRRYISTFIDIKGSKERIKRIEAQLVRDNADEEIARVFAEEDIFISAVEMVAKIGKDGVGDLKERFPDFFQALENKVREI